MSSGWIDLQSEKAPRPSSSVVLDMAAGINKIKLSETLGWEEQGFVNLLDNGNFEIGDPPTKWTLVGAGATLSRSNVQAKVGTYSALLTRSGADCYSYQTSASYTYYKGRTVTFGCWIYATVASRACLFINDGVAGAQSSYHSGVAGWEWIILTYTMSAVATELTVSCRVITGDTSAYFDGAVLVEGRVAPPFSTKVELLTTDISAGHILLSSTVKDGEWYNESGVEIDATHGINIYGVANALTTRATKAGTIQCYVGADGIIYAGAGAVKLSSGGIEITGSTALKFTYSGSYPCYIYTDAAGDLVLVADSGMVYTASKLGIGTTGYFGLLLSIVSAGKLNWFTDGGTLDHVFGPDVANYGKLGTDVLYWYNICAEILSAHGGVYPNTSYLTPAGYCGSAGYYWIQVHSDEYVTHSPKKVEMALDKVKAIRFGGDKKFDFTTLPQDIVADGAASLEFVKNHKRRDAESTRTSAHAEAKGDKVKEAKAQTDYDEMMAELDAQVAKPGIELGGLSSMLLCAMQELTTKVEALEGRIP